MAVKTWADQVTEKYFQDIKDVTAEELAALPPRVLEEKGKKYLCYFLRSQKAPNRTYSGSTNNFPHRIRQHNGIIAGGARMTETTRPWRVACLVIGFPDRSAALRFEFFTKTSHTKIDGRGLNALQRRAALIAEAEKKMTRAVRQGLTYHVPDPYFRECLEVARVNPLLRMFSQQNPEPTVPEWHDQQGNILTQSKKKKKRKRPAVTSKYLLDVFYSVPRSVQTLKEHQAVVIAAELKALLELLAVLDPAEVRYGYHRSLQRVIVGDV